MVRRLSRGLLCRLSKFQSMLEKKGIVSKLRQNLEAIPTYMQSCDWKHDLDGKGAGKSQTKVPEQVLLIPHRYNSLGLSGGKEGCLCR